MYNVSCMETMNYYGEKCVLSTFAAFKSFLGFYLVNDIIKLLKTKLSMVDAAIILNQPLQTWFLIILMIFCIDWKPKKLFKKFYIGNVLHHITFAVYHNY